MTGRRFENLDPERQGTAAAWLRGLAEGRLTRRDFVLRATALGLSASAIGGLLAACGGGKSSDGASASPMDTALPEKITIYNWGFYMNPKVKADFEKLHGVKVVEKTFGSQDAMYATVKKAAIPYDAVWGSDFWVTIMGKAGLVRSLDLTLLPNLKNVTDPQLRNPAFDDQAQQDGKKYSVPYMFGTTGFAVRLDKIPAPQPTWGMLYEEKNRGKICMLDGSREILGPALFLLGYSLNTTSQAELDEATRKAIEQKPLVVKYDSITQMKSILDGVPLVECWDGDAVGAMNKAGISKIRYVLPDEGYQIWADGICIPTNAPNPYAAHLFLDYLLDPKVAAENANYIGYQPAVAAADPMIKSLVQRSQRPTSEVLARGTMSVDLGAFNDAFEKAYARIRAAG